MWSYYAGCYFLLRASVPHGDQSHYTIIHVEVYPKTERGEGGEGRRGERNEPPGD
jgi:hypothetical protein